MRFIGAVGLFFLGLKAVKYFLKMVIPFLELMPLF